MFNTGWHYESDSPAEFDFVKPRLKNGCGFRFRRKHTEGDLNVGSTGPALRRGQPGTSWFTSDVINANIPCWFLAILTAALPTRALFRLARRHRRPGFCRTCGYDLRATPNRCPECGAMPNEPIPQSSPV